ncbi:MULTISPECIES: DUF2798 domain-containing protein [Rhizobium]|uniref:DUF2798 domain-containing protein n=1 Tax=Rhizobium sophoriradicis TaxID=1535245 RepID=A0A2A5KS97_9HYPH|nr:MULTISPECIES: DUF2798 domain-containing protein [Rhizobium]UWU34515.1 DUF2798 domain-containing protein [Rhizobium leguminosarum bv. phaseoli]ARQ56242.1 hypothetical protein Kim5_CH00115 [Rhizobium sp. Kim5]PCK79929.1 DUF2798 domain-containing protein [Rhizobium sophoriradicis]PCK86757.1 DUF2798 domain-containing protein [Rhizobium sophoriradicis]RSB90072.1 DUF2798 domain-containing protein [Rhizobium sophoriradicis]
MPKGKLPKRYNAVVMPLTLSLLMTSVVSAISFLKSQGPTATAFAMWPSAWALSWAITFPVLLVVKRLTAVILET